MSAPTKALQGLRQLVAAVWATIRWHLSPLRGRPCADLESFHDGSLDLPRADLFTAHLPDCRRCQAGLTGLMQLDVLGRHYAEDQRERAR